LSNQVQAVGRSGPTALDAATAGGGVVQAHPLPHPYVGDARAGGDHLADDLVAGYQRVGWPELAVVQMQIRPADPGNQDAEQHLTHAGSERGIWRTSNLPGRS
jgi:hypothetical protein